VSSRILAPEEALARILAAHASAALSAPVDDEEVRQAEQGALWAKYVYFGADRWAVGKAVRAVYPHEPWKHESAQRWLRRERAKRSGHVRMAG
jgi:hypothetical protein